MMKKSDNRETTQFTLCICNDEYPASLVRGKVYRLREDPEAARQNLVRVIDESGEDYLYPDKLFVEIDLPQAAQDALVA